MECRSFVRNGVLRLPPGFRFHPTDEELVLHYLRRRVLACPLPASVIHDIDLSTHSPWDLLGGSNEERYFFSLREGKHPNGRRTSSGYWKAVGKEKPVLSPRCNQVVGMKRAFVFYQGKPRATPQRRTDWIMHEYRLAGACGNSIRKNSAPHNNSTDVRDWVLCRIFKKKRAANANMDAEAAEHEADDAARQTQTPVSSSESSCVTDGSSCSGEEATSRGRSNSSP